MLYPRIQSHRRISGDSSVGRGRVAGIINDGRVGRVGIGASSPFGTGRHRRFTGPRLGGCPDGGPPVTAVSHCVSPDRPDGCIPVFARLNAAGDRAGLAHQLL